MRQLNTAAKRKGRIPPRYVGHCVLKWLDLAQAMTFRNIHSDSGQFSEVLINMFVFRPSSYACLFRQHHMVSKRGMCHVA